jgi:hypothetical protein
MRSPVCLSSLEVSSPALVYSCAGVGVCVEQEGRGSEGRTSGRKWYQPGSGCSIIPHMPMPAPQHQRSATPSMTLLVFPIAPPLPSPPLLSTPCSSPRHHAPPL